LADEDLQPVDGFQAALSRRAEEIRRLVAVDKVD
jgi:hypothetical protein